MKKLIFSLFLFPSLSWSAIDPLSSQFMPFIDENPAHYTTSLGTITVTDSLYKVTRSSVAPGNLHWFVGYAAKNEIQSFQVHVSPSVNIASLTVTMSNLVDTQTVPTSVIYATSTDIVVYREFYMNISTPSCLSPVSYMGGLRDYMPDPLIPAVDPYWHQTTNAFPVPVLSGQTQSAWIDVHIPSGTPSGYYSGSVYVSNGGVVVSTLPVVFGVWNWTMPSTAGLGMAGSNFDYNGFNNVAYGPGGGAYPNAGSADRANLYEWIDGSAQMLDNRWTVYNPAYTYPDSGSFTDYLNNIGPLIDGTTAHVKTILPGASLNKVAINNLSFAAPVWQNFATNFNNRGWMSKLVYKAVDEPSPSQWPAVISSMTATRSFSSPAIPNLITTDMATVKKFGAENLVDQIAPLIESVEYPGQPNKRADYDAWLAASSGTVRQIGSYNDCESAGTCANGYIGAANTPPFPNRHIDGTPVANRAMETWMFLNRINFGLYFAVDYCDTAVWQCGSSPWRSVYAFGGNGDGTLIYPSTGTYVTTSGNIPIWCPSIRLKHYRDGEQDWEYENYLAQHGQSDFVAAQIATWMTNGYTFNNNPDGIRKARSAMGNKIHQLLSVEVSSSTQINQTFQGTITIKGTMQ